MKLSSEQNKTLKAILKESDKKRNEYYKNIVKKFIRNTPNLVYALILLDNSLGPLALSQNGILKEIIDNKEKSVIQKTQEIINLLLNVILKEPNYLKDLLSSYTIIQAIKSDKINFSFTEPKVLATVIVWILQINKRVNEKN